MVEVDGNPDAVVTLDGPNAGTIVLPEGSPGGEFQVTLDCTTDAGPQSFRSFVDFGQVVIEKVVEGDVPADATFVVDVTCETGALGAAAEYGAAPEGFFLDPLQGQVTFGAGGGTDYLVHYSGQDCTITEPEDGGAVSTTIDTTDCGTEEGPMDGAGAEADAGVSGDFAILEPVDCIQTVTNVFSTAPAPAAVAITPTFTG